MQRSTPLTREVARRLAAVIEQHRREVVASAFAAAGDGATVSSLGASVFANALLDRLGAEFEHGDVRTLDAWIAAVDHSDTTLDHARVAFLVCLALSARFAASFGVDDATLRYLSFRATALEKLIEMARTSSKRTKSVDPAALVPKDEVVLTLLAAIEASDPLTCEHSRAVGAWCGRIAKALGLGAEAQEFAVLCGTLHDVGKVATPRTVLQKPGPLTSDEWIEMRAHSADGGTLVGRIPSLQEAAPIVRAHHERIDGKGYPDGLRGDEIPLLARIVSVADSFHAMISRRPYREAMSASAAIEILMAGRGTQWDPVVVDTMVGIVKPVSAQPKLRVVNR